MYTVFYSIGYVIWNFKFPPKEFADIHNYWIRLAKKNNIEPLWFHCLFSLANIVILVWVALVIAYTLPTIVITFGILFTVMIGIMITD
jgi:hypothetical protein